MRRKKAKMTPDGGMILNLSGMNKGTVQRVFRFIWIKGNLLKQMHHKPCCFS